MGKVLPTHSIRTFRYKPLVALDDSSWWIDCLLLLMVFVYARVLEPGAALDDHPSFGYDGA